MHVKVGVVVEGHGDRAALPVVLRRLVSHLRPGVSVAVARPVRVARDGLVRRRGERHRAIELAGAKAGVGRPVLLVVDADDDCPAELARTWLSDARRDCPGPPVYVVVAKREFEAWFLASAHSLGGKRGLAHDLEPPPDPEAVQGAKEWLSRRMAARR